MVSEPTALNPTGKASSASRAEVRGRPCLIRASHFTPRQPGKQPAAARFGQAQPRNGFAAAVAVCPTAQLLGPVSDLTSWKAHQTPDCEATQHPIQHFISYKISGQLPSACATPSTSDPSQPSLLGRRQIPRNQAANYATTKSLLFFQTERQHQPSHNSSRRDDTTHHSIVPPAPRLPT